MDFQSIEAERVRRGVSQSRLCQLAGVHPTTYSRRLTDPDGVSGRTLRRLRAALDTLARGPAAAEERGA